MSVIERFLEKISVAQNGCWDWIAHLSPKGYGKIWSAEKTLRSHRFIYEYFYGYISDNLVVHHKCHNPKCVNPLHLEQLTIGNNVLDCESKALAALNKRKTHCKRGHEFTKENTSMDGRGNRYCKKCTVIRSREWQRKKSRERKLLNCVV